LLRNGGLVSFVTPDSWLKVPQAKKLRQIVLDTMSISLITALPQKVFYNVSANCVVFILLKAKGPGRFLVNIFLPKSQLSDLAREKFDERYEVNSDDWKHTSDFQFQIFQKKETADIISGIQTRCSKGIDYLDVMQGIVPYSQEEHSKDAIEERRFHAPRKVSNEYGIWIQGRAISRFSLAIKDVEYLRYGPWLHRPRKPKYFEGPRILIQEITGGHPPRISACYCDTILYHDPGIISCLNVGTLPTNFLLGILNSRFLSWYHRYASPKGTRHAFPKVLIGDIRGFPIPRVDLKDPKDKTRYDNMLKLVERMLDLHRQLDKAKNPNDKTRLQREIDATDRQIDQLVYELYGLTEEEIKIVEEETAK
jgi:adenine-specific DNA-methyltransferase